MKELWIEIRLFIAEKLLSWASSIAPETESGLRMRTKITSYFFHEFIKNTK